MKNQKIHPVIVEFGEQIKELGYHSLYPFSFDDSENSITNTLFIYDNARDIGKFVYFHTIEFVNDQRIVAVEVIVQFIGNKDNFNNYHLKPEGHAHTLGFVLTKREYQHYVNFIQVVDFLRRVKRF